MGPYYTVQLVTKYAAKWVWTFKKKVIVSCDYNRLRDSIFFFSFISVIYPMTVLLTPTHTALNQPSNNIFSSRQDRNSSPYTPSESCSLLSKHECQNSFSVILHAISEGSSDWLGALCCKKKSPAYACISVCRGGIPLNDINLQCRNFQLVLQ